MMIRSPLKCHTGMDNLSKARPWTLVNPRAPTGLPAPVAGSMVISWSEEMSVP